MDHTVTGLADKPLDAQLVISDLVDLCLCDRSDISLMAGEQAGEAAGAPAQALKLAGQLTTAAGTAAATALGGLFGAASSMASRRVSGMGMVSAAGEFGALLAKTALTTSADMAKALSGLGMDARLAGDYSEALASGKILVMVRARSDKAAQCARKVMATRGVTTEASPAH